MKTKKNYGVIAATIVLFFACEKDGITITPIKNFISEGNVDGYIENLTTPVVHDYYSAPQGKSLCVGWNGNGYSMRGFLSFNIAEIMPASGKELIIDDAVLQVYESNTNMHPFDGSGTRVVNCYLVNYDTLDKTDYTQASLADCGIIATWGYNVLEEHALKVTTPVNNFIKANPTGSKIQFRLQFVPDGNVQTPSPLTNSMWLIFSGDETGKSDYRPKLTIKYHYR